MRNWTIKFDEHELSCRMVPYLLAGRAVVGEIDNRSFRVRWEPALHSLFIHFSDEKVERVVRLRNQSCEHIREDLKSLIKLSLSGMRGSQTEIEIAPTGKDIIYRKRNLSSKGYVLKSPMTGKILDVFKSPGDAINQGEVIAIIEAMKMENKIQSRQNGILDEVNVHKGDNIQVGSVIAVIKQGSSS